MAINKDLALVAPSLEGTRVAAECCGEGVLKCETTSQDSVVTSNLLLISIHLGVHGGFSFLGA